jgi:hypothetical protein
MFLDDQAKTPDLHELLSQTLKEGCDARDKYRLLKKTGEDVSLMENFFNSPSSSAAALFRP